MPDFKNLNKFLGGQPVTPPNPNINPEAAQQIQNGFNGAFGMPSTQPAPQQPTTDAGTLEKLLGLLK